MATLAPPSPTSPSGRRRRKSFMRKCERHCCNVIQYFPLSFVYGLTTWAVWVETRMCFEMGHWIRYFLAFLGVLLWAILNWSYTTAVFTDPGCPSNTAPGYSSLPTTEPSNAVGSLTVKSSGEMRFCKKCQAKKPDRAHHCSTCRRCVLKMDHHCPWLATCVGLRNYKPFLLFLIYTTFFCWVCFAVSAKWIWDSIIIAGAVEDSLMPVNYILLSVLSGIIGLVVGGFTAWHVHLTLKGKTTIESLEQTRYLSPLRQQMSSHLNPHRTYADDNNHSFGEQLRDFGDAITEIHANALPGVLRPEEGEERMSPAQNSLRRNFSWDQAERQRERDRYNDYLDEQDNEKLPNAFDLGYRANWRRVMGAQPWLWGIPVCNAMGDGWTWEVSEKWREATERIRLRREEEMTRHGLALPAMHQQGAGAANVPLRRASPSTRPPPSDWRALEHKSGSSTPMRDLDRSDGYDTSSDEEALSDTRARLLGTTTRGQNWNDLPEDMINGRKRSPRGDGRKGK